MKYGYSDYVRLTKMLLSILGDGIVKFWEEKRLKMKRCVLVAFVLFAVMTVFTSYAQSSQAGDAAKGSISLYTSMPEANATKLIKEFNKKYPNAKIELYRAGTGTVLAKLQAELQANNVVADVVVVAEPDASFALKNMGMLLQFTPQGASDLPPVYKDKDGYFYAFNTTAMTIMYNTSKIKKAPVSYNEMLDAAYRGKVVVPDPGNSGAAAHFIGTLLNNGFGWDFFKKLESNKAVVVKGPSDAAKMVATGESWIGISQDVTILDLKSSGSPVDIVYPKEGIVVKNNNVEIMKSSDNIPLAKIWVEFLLTPQIQQFMYDNKIGNPVIKNIVYPKDAVKISDIPAMKNSDDFIAANPDIKEQFGTIFQ